MGKLNVSSVRAPSDYGSVVASPPQLMNEKQTLDSHVFGTGKKRNLHANTNKPGQKKINSDIDVFLDQAEKTEEVNEMLIDAIKAKLAILDSMDD